METFHRLIFPSNKKIGQKEPSLLSENEGDGCRFFNVALFAGVLLPLPSKKHFAMKNDMKIVLRGIQPRHNGESAVPGTASTVINLREREEALEVVGVPRQVGTLSPGDRVLLVDDDNTLVLRDNKVMVGDTVVLDAGCPVTGAHKVGALIVVVTQEGKQLLRRSATGYDHLNVEDAIPQLHLAAVEQSTLSTTIPDYDFQAPYTAWQAPLAQADVAALTRLVGNAVSSMSASASEQGRFTGVMLARYGVRLWDDSYLWLSQPVMVGNSLISASYRATATVKSGNNVFTGINSFALTLDSYRLGITMLSSVAPLWRDLVKAIDVMVTPAASLVDTRASIDYRCVVSTSSGTRRYLLEMGPEGRSTAAMTQSMLGKGWKVAASCTRLDAGAFVGVNTTVSSQRPVSTHRCDVIAATLDAPRWHSAQQCAAIMEPRGLVTAATVTMEHNGRLYEAPSQLALTCPWQVLPWLSGTIDASTVNATVQVTLSTSDGNVVLTTQSQCPCNATALNPFIAFPDPRATHIAIAVASKVWESDLNTLEGSDMAVSINPSFASNALTAGTIPAGGDSTVLLPAEGMIRVSHIGNPLVINWQATVSGCSILALAPACRPIYSGGFGRYPVYLFTSRGIMALPQRASEAFAEPRLISQQVIATGATPLAAGDAVWFVSMHGDLCALAGSTVKRMLGGVEHLAQLAWNNRDRELWIAASDGSVTVMMPSGNYYHRSQHVSALFSDSSHALAVTSTGRLLDLTDEIPATVAVEYLSQPFETDPLMRQQPGRIIWNIFTPIAATPAAFALTATLRGERGASCHGFIMSRLTATGLVAAPLSRPIVAPPARTLRLQVTATIPTATLLRPTHLRL